MNMNKQKITFFFLTAAFKKVNSVTVTDVREHELGTHVHDVGAVCGGDQHVELKRYVQDVGEVGRSLHCFETPKKEPATQSEKNPRT